MKNLPVVPELDKDELVSNIKGIFLQFDRYLYRRVLCEFFTAEGTFIGDNLTETTFALREGKSPMIYEVSGPYDSVSNEYATIARVLEGGKILYECDLKPGILQRTAAMTLLYLNTLRHRPEHVILFGAGKLGLHIAQYLKHFISDMKQLDYSDSKGMLPDFEKRLAELGVKADYISSPYLTKYDTLIMATNTREHLLQSKNFDQISPGTFVVSLCTTSQTGEISEEIYSRTDVNLLLDYPETKTFTADMRRAEEKGYLASAILFKDVLQHEVSPDLVSKVNILRLTGTPMQNIAVIQMMLALENLTIT